LDVVRSKYSGERFLQTYAVNILPLNYEILFTALQCDQEFSPPELTAFCRRVMWK